LLVEAEAADVAKVIDDSAREKVVTEIATDAKIKETTEKVLSDTINIIGRDSTTKSAGSGQAIIGGGCCVQLSVEYMPVKPVLAVDSTSDPCRVTVEVLDSEGCLLVWRKGFMEGYHVKESIITTYPGARLTVSVNNAIARVRWCEVFSC
jgi:hypothetical protein